MSGVFETVASGSVIPEKHEANIAIDAEEEEDENDHPIEEVQLTVPTTDDPSQLALTFRTWFLGIASCLALSFINTFFSYRTNTLFVTSLTFQIITLPMGNFMAATLPTKQFRFPGTKSSFSLNPGPFNMKEHVLISILASCGASGVYALNIVTIVKAYYHREMHPVAAMLLAQTTQLLGYGWAGMFRRFLVDSPYMWWPSNLIQVSLFRALHEKEEKKKGQHTRLQFFLIVCFASFIYYLIPGFFFPSLSNISIVCLIWTKSVLAQQIGSGKKGLGVGSFGLDWSTVAGFLGTPLAVPFFAIANVFVGFVLFVYVLVPIFYWSNAYDAKKFPILSSDTFDQDGQKYNITRILNQQEFNINMVAYNGYSKLYLGILFALTYGFSFGSLTSTLSHVALFDGKMIWKMWKKTTSATKDKLEDVHTRLMKKNYKQVPEWWFISILVVSVALSIYACEGFGKQLQLPWWGVLLASFIALFFTLPIGVIQATTNMQPGLNVVTELIIGFIYPGRPLANITFKTYGYISMSQALAFIQDIKLGQYMKIPPRSLFITQLAGTIIASTACFGTTWWLMSSVKNICDTSLLPESSPWTCPGYDVFYSASIVWGVIGPQKMFTKDGVYPQLNWFFLIGLLSPVPFWYLSRKFPEKKWLKQVHMPIIFAATSTMPASKPVHYWSWLAVGFFFNYYVYSRHKGWWARHNYIMSAGLDAGVAFMAVLLYFAFQSNNISIPDWWGLDAGDHCPLAMCPTAKGIVVDGCPVL